MMANVQADRRTDGRAGSRRIFPPQFKLQVLEAYRRDAQCRGNQRATARKFGIHRRQIQKWLQAEGSLKAALLRRAPQPAPSPPPYSVGSPESARLPSPSPPAPACSSLHQGQAVSSVHNTVLMLHCTSVVHTTTAIQPPPVANSPTMMHCQPAVHSPTILYAAQAAPTPTALHSPSPVFTLVPSEPIDLSLKRVMPEPETVRKPFKLFRPYLPDEEKEEKQPRKSAFAPVLSGCGLSACRAPLWSAAACHTGATLR